MSFGFGVGDFLAVYNHVDRVRRQYLDAPQEYASILDSTRSLSSILRDLNDLRDRVDLTDEQAASLKAAAAGCVDVLDSLELIVSKYSCLNASDIKSRKSIKRLWKRFRVDPEDIRNVRARLVSTLASFNAIYSNIIGEEVGFLSQSEADRKLLDVANWFTPAKFAEQQSDYLAQRSSGTCNWFLDDSRFQHWRDNKDSGSTLVCSGIPGSGKTILLAAIVEHLQKMHFTQPDTIILYHYYNFRRVEEQSLLYVISSFIRQILQQQGHVLPAISKLYEKHRGIGRPSTEELKTLFRELVSSFQRTYIVLDALDEAHDPHGRVRLDLLDLVLEIQTQQPNLSLLVSTRERTDILEYPTLKGHEKIEIRARAEDIENYLEGRMSELMSGVRRNTNLQAHIKSQITTSSDGMFLLARLHFDSLCGETTPRAVQKVLNSLSQGVDALSAAYESAKERIDQQSKGHRELAYQVLMWISCGVQELTVHQLQHALAVQPEIGDISDEYDLVDEQDLLSVCAGLVVVDVESNTTRLVHFTLQEYLDQVSSDWFPNANTVLAAKCVQYLVLDVFGSYSEPSEHEITKILRHPNFYGYSFLEHATRYWGIYAGRSKDQQLICDLFQTLSAKPRQFQNSCRLLAYENHAFGRESTIWCENATVLHVAACFGFKIFAESLLDSGHELRPKDSREMDPLMWAIKYGQKSMVELFLNRSNISMTEATDWRGVTALMYAASNGHDDIVKYLLQRSDVDPNVLSDYDGSALTFAVSQGHIDTVRTLLSHPNIDPQAKKDDGSWSLMQAAAWHGQLEILDLLLDKLGWETGDWASGKSSPLHLAAYQGHVQILEFLLKRSEVDVNAIDADGCSAFSVAAAQNQTDALKLLLSQPQLMPDLKNNSGKTPLMMAVDASIFTRLRTIKLLVNHAAVNLNSRDQYGNSALVYAIRKVVSMGNRSQKIIEFLLSIADIDAVTGDKDGYTPLHHAVLRGNDVAVKLLLQHSNANAGIRTNDGHTAVSLFIQEDRVQTAVRSKTVDWYAIEATAQEEPDTLSTKADTPTEMADKEDRQAEQRPVLKRPPKVFLPRPMCNGMPWRDRNKPFVVIIASDREPDFALSFYMKDLIDGKLRVKQVWTALGEHWHVDTQYLRLNFEGMDLTIGWLPLDEYRWEEGDTIDAEVASTGQSFEYSAAEIADYDQNSWSCTWRALREGSQGKDGVSQAYVHRNPGFSDYISFAFGGEDTEDDDDDDDEKKNDAPHRKLNSTEDLRARSSIFEMIEELKTKGTVAL